MTVEELRGMTHEDLVRRVQELEEANEKLAEEKNTWYKSWSTFGMVLIAILLIHRIIPTSFLPIEDQGYFKIELELPEGATLERTRIVTERAVEYLMKNPAVEYVQSVAGSSPRVGTSQARSELTVILKPWEERDSQTIDNIMAQVKKDMSQYPECKVYLSTPPVIPGLGSSGGFEMQLEARGGGKTAIQRVGKRR